MNSSTLEASAIEAWVDDQKLWVRLADGRVLGTPLSYFPRLFHARAEDRQKMEIGPGGLGLSWPAIDEDIAVAGLLEGRGDETLEGRSHRDECRVCSAPGDAT